MNINRAPLYVRRRATVAGAALSIGGLLAGPSAVSAVVDRLDGLECEGIQAATVPFGSNAWAVSSEHIDGAEHLNRQDVLYEVAAMNPQLASIGNVAANSTIILPLSCNR